MDTSPCAPVTAAPAASLTAPAPVYPPAFPPPWAYSYFPSHGGGNSSPPEEDVFVAVNLPVNNDGGGGASSSMCAVEAPLPPLLLPSSSHHSHLSNMAGGCSPSHSQRINYQHRPTRPPPALPPPNKPLPTKHAITTTTYKDLVSGGGSKDDSKPGDHYHYVQFAAERPTPSQQQQHQPLVPVSHEYCYPVMEVQKPDSSKERRDSIASIKKANHQIEQEQLAISTTTSSGGGIGFAMGKRSGRNTGLDKSKFGSIVKGVNKPRNDGKRNDKHRITGGLGSFGGISLKQRCRHCQESFYPDINPKGSCEYAPDLIRTAIDTVTCIICAQCMLYHCMSDEEGEFVRHPCACSLGCCGGGGHKSRCCCLCCADGDASDGVGVNNEMMGFGGNNLAGNAMEGNSRSCGRRWIGLTLLSLLVPCLCCYPPLRACHSAFVYCGLCGGRHDPVAGGGRHSDKYSGKENKYLSGRGGGRYSTGCGRFDSVGGS